MNILILYASNSGSTHITSLLIHEVLSKSHNVVLQKACDVNLDKLSDFTHLFIGSPSWFVNGMEAMPHEDILDLLERLSTFELGHLKVASYGCGDSSYTHFCGAVDYIEDFFKSKNLKSFFEPLKVNEFFYNQQENEELIKKWATSLVAHL